MARVLVVLLAAALVLASGAHAKGPHAVLTPGPDAVEAGRPWRVTLELIEWGRGSNIDLIARQGNRDLVATARRVSDRLHGTVRYKMRLTFPSSGRWEVLALSGKRRFDFPAVAVGSGRVPRAYVAFPLGSRAQLEGGGGFYAGPGPPEPADVYRGTPLPPDEFSVATNEPDGGGLPGWLLAITGVVLAGAGIVTVRLR